MNKHCNQAFKEYHEKRKIKKTRKKKVQKYKINWEDGKIERTGETLLSITQKKKS
jgi:hypothetical protein